MTKWAMVLACAALAGAAASGADAAPFTERFVPVELAVGARLAGIPEGGEARAQRRALEKCLRAIGRTSRSDEQDLALLASLARTLDRAFPGDAEFGPALDDVHAAFRADAADDRARLQQFVATIDPLTERFDRALREAEAVDAALAKADAAETRTEAAARMRAAVRRIGVAWTRVLGLPRSYFGRPDGSDVSCLVDGAPFRAHAVTSIYAPAIGAVIVGGFEFVEPVPGAARLVGVAAQGVTGPGSYPLVQFFDGPSAAYEELVTSMPDEVVNGWYTSPAPAPHDGRLDITVLDFERRLVEGTFSFTGYAAPGTPGSDARTVTQGSFRVRIQRVVR